MKITAQVPVIGMDIAKNTFQIHAVDPETGEIERIKLKRAKVAEFFANRQPSLVALEACGGGHHWARTLSAQGHQVKLLPARHVKAFVLRDKTDARDAQAIWVAAQQPHIREVPVKSEQQQACLALHRMRAQLMKMRIMQTNALRGLLCEFGIVLPEGHRTLLQRIPGELAQAQDKLPGVLIESMQEQLSRIERLQQDIDHIDRRGRCQASCRKKFDAQAIFWVSWFWFCCVSGLRWTSAIRSQFRVGPDQRFGLASRAAAYTLARSSRRA